ncbi:MAG: RNA polymerase sigma factor [Clostridiales bacterium]|jgi:RNA polymerase sigma-70 factor (ECF subfamily)|nr:RNA polymerase sigma factor [Clostridiales bacterium]
MLNRIEKYCVENRTVMYRLAYGYTKNRDDALDVVSDAVLRALTTKSAPRGEELKPWFYGIVVSAALDFLRKRKDRANIEGGDALMNIPASGDNAPDEDLMEAVNRLPEPDRTIIMLRFFEDLKIEDVAKATNLRVSTTKTRLYAALKKMRGFSQLAEYAKNTATM